jgi:class 3 adenylate cyclase
MSNSSNQPRLSTRLLTGFLSIPVRFKISLPYLIVIPALAALAVWLMNQSFSRALQERFQNQLTIGAAAANSDLAFAESAQLTDLQLLLQTPGLAEAVDAHDWNTIDRLVRPLTISANLRLVHIIDRNGLPLYGLRALATGFAENENAPFVTWSPVMEVMKGHTDSLGDKFVGIAEAPWGLALYTAGPIKLDDELMGVILVGSPLSEVLTSIQSGTGGTVTVYRPLGQAALSTLSEGQVPDNLDSTIVRGLSQAAVGQPHSRTVLLSAVVSDESLTAIRLRGQPTNWIVGVAWPKPALSGQPGPAELAGGLLLGVLVLIGIGWMVARLITIPVADLTTKVAEIGQGNLNATAHYVGNDEVGALGREFNAMARELRQREMVREMFGQLVSAEVREALENGQIGLGGELKVVTILFTDIRDFTSLAENFNPQEVVTLLNNYFEVISVAIHKAGGFINKFGGDSTMAVFGAPLTTEPGRSAHQALQAAFAIRTHLAEFNARQIEHGQQPIRIGIGISTGEVVTGNIGSKDRYEYTVIGDTVNTAARVQSLCTRFNDSNILITEDTRQALGKDAQLLVIDHGDVALKGKQKLVRVYGVMGMRFSKAEPVFQVSGIPRRDVLEALYLYCKGYHPRVIGQTKNIDPLVVNQWIESATRVYERSCEELRQEFSLSEVELHRLGNGNGHGARPAVEAKTVPGVNKTNGRSNGK